MPAGPIEVVLATIRQLESGGDYRAQARGSSASGAYQFLDSTWDGYGGYTHARDAPPAVQDAKAADLARSILDRHGGDVTAVPVVWYIGHVPDPGSSEWDTVPAPDAGNTAHPTPVPSQVDGRLPASTSTPPPPMRPATVAPAAACVGGAVAAIGGEWSLPGPRALIDANPGALDDPHHDYPAWDWLIPEGTPIYAVRGGTVATIRNWPHNWWTTGCGTSGGGDCDTCGVGVTIVDDSGTRWTYCHGSGLTTTLGATVAAGQQILWSGNTGRSGAPHLHLEIRVDGIQRCPQPLLASLYTNAVGIEPAALPRSGCSF